MVDSKQFTMNDSIEVSEAYSNFTVDYYGPVATGIFGTWLVLIIFLSIFGNLLVIIVIVKDQNMRTAKNGTNLFLVNLAISDMMVGICMAPVSLNTLIHEEWRFPDWMCSMNSFFNTLFLFVSIHTLMYISVHKCWSIRRLSNLDQAPISRKICLAFIFAAWLWGLLFGILTISALSKAVYLPKKLQCGPKYPSFNYKDIGLFLANFTFNFILPFVIMAVCYRKIFTIIKESVKFRRSSVASCSSINNLAQDKQLTITLLLVLGVFIICWIPYVVYVFYALFLKDKGDIPALMNPLAYCFGFTNSICNPFIYGFRSKDFNDGYRSVFINIKRISMRLIGKEEPPEIVPVNNKSVKANKT